VPELHTDRIQRELFLAVFGPNAHPAEAWVAERLTMLLEEQQSRPGEKLFVAGDRPDHYYFLRSGKVRFDREGATSRVCEGPSAFGISDALLRRPRTTSAVAETGIEAMRVRCADWIELLEDSFSLARAAVLAAARSVAELEQRHWLASPREPASERPLWHGHALDVVDRLSVLAGTPLLRSAGVQTLSDLATVSEVVPLAPGQVVVEHGRATDRIHLLLDGQVEAVREDPTVHWRGGPGDIVCGTAAFTDAASAWKARCTAPGHALVFRIADWLDLMEEHFDMVRATLGALALDEEALIERLSPAPGR
jgi:CRP-like cAMP-binding protein